MLNWTHKDPQAAFECAIRSGRLSADPSHPRYAGNYMYMGTDPDGRDQYKHIMTRRYLTV